MQNDLIQELGTNFIEYAAAVNSDRSIPDAKSGLKPVARRILWSAFSNGQSSNKPHVKAATIVGNVIGQLHPHGDSSVYGAMVRLSQNWVMRYPLIDWHGNNGNIAGDGPAHYRYTEARLSKIAEDGLLDNIKKKNVEFMPNFDETQEEPCTLPAIFPNLLCNPNSGIGVAIASSWLSHNLNEVAQAIYDYIDGGEPSIPGPDFPTGGVIINASEMPAIIARGRGTVKIRGQYKIEKNCIVFYEIPYGTCTETLLTEIGKACDDGDIQGVIDIRDESNKKGLRLVLECQKNAILENIVQQVFTKTNLQTTISYNQVALVDKTPTELGLKDCIKIYLDHNINCLIKEISYDLNKIETRLNIVNGLLRALEDIDNIITLIKTSESSSKARDNLIIKYKFNEEQAKAIIDMKLGKLAGLEKIELQDEKAELENNKTKLTILSTNQALQIETIKTRLQALVKKYGDARRTQLLDIAEPPKDKKAKEKPVIIAEDCIVTVFDNGNVKRAPIPKTTRRNTVGTKTKDGIVYSCKSTTLNNLFVFSSKGKMYKILINDIPDSDRGTSLATLTKMEVDERALTYATEEAEKKYIFFITKAGIAKKVPVEEFLNMKKSGIIATKFNDGDTLATVVATNDGPISIITKNGMCSTFNLSTMSSSSRTAKGMKGINLSAGDEVVAAVPHEEAGRLAVVSADGCGKRIEETLAVQGRGTKGVVVSKTPLGGAAWVKDNESIMVVGNHSSVCVAAKDIPVLARTAIGVKIIKNNNNVKLVVRV